MEKVGKPTGAFWVVFIGAVWTTFMGVIVLWHTTTIGGISPIVPIMRLAYATVSIMNLILGFSLGFLSFGLRAPAETYSDRGKLIIVISVMSLLSFLALTFISRDLLSSLFLLVGSVFGVIGGIKAMKWHRPPSLPQVPSLTATQIETKPEVMREREIVREKEVMVKVRCLYCRRLYNETENECPYCRGSR